MENKLNARPIKVGFVFDQDCKEKLHQMAQAEDMSESQFLRRLIRREWELTVYRMIEAPAYVGLAILYLASYWNAMPGIGSFQAVPMRFPDEG